MNTYEVFLTPDHLITVEADYVIYNDNSIIFEKHIKSKDATEMVAMFGLHMITGWKIVTK